MLGKRTLFGMLLMLTLTANDESDAFDRTITALHNGLAAHGRPGQRVREAGATLVAVGARPIAGDDLAVRWSKGSELSRYRDRALGPGYRAVSLDGGRTEQVFLAGQRAHVALVSLDHTAFTLEVSDDQGVKQCQRGTSNRCVWIPLWTTRYRIDVVNPGTRPGNNYLVMQ
jgi:hypothetical protein